MLSYTNLNTFSIATLSQFFVFIYHLQSWNFRSEWSLSLVACNYTRSHCLGGEAMFIYWMFAHLNSIHCSCTASDGLVHMMERTNVNYQAIFIRLKEEFNTINFKSKNVVLGLCSHGLDWSHRIYFSIIYTEETTFCVFGTYIVDRLLTYLLYQNDIQEGMCSNMQFPLSFTSNPQDYCIANALQ